MSLGAQQLAWRIGGPQGSGINRIARFFARACAAQGAEVICRREYHSNIMGRHSYNDTLMGDGVVTCHREATDMLVAFEAETLCRHALSVAAGGSIIYASDDADIAFERLPYLDQRLRSDLGAALEAAGLQAGTGGLLQMAAQQGVKCISVPYGSLLSGLAAELDLPEKAVSAAVNTIAVSISSALIGMPEQQLLRAVEAAFAGRDDLVSMNRAAVAIACRYARDHLEPRAAGVPDAGIATERLLLDASQSVALGKLAAGMGSRATIPSARPQTKACSWKAGQRLP